ncbi:MAG: ABC transporter ATP-binding protein [Nitrososphaerota archaeon]|nr:ABC transporter ATP-binding protein [Nitrososphaerota archaeon]
MSILKVDAVTKKFGGLVAVDGVSLEVDKKDILGVIGPNGSGKTTLFNLISGFYPLNSGKIILEDTNITGWPPYRVTKAGIARTFQNTRPFLNLTIRDNVMVGALLVRSNMEGAAEIAGEVLEEVGLKEKAERLAKDTSIQDRKRLEVARALSMSPKVLLLDEPMAGLTEGEIGDFLLLIRKVRERGVSIVLIEHIVKAVQQVADRMAVLDYGKKICEGAPAEVVRNQDVLKAYLGEDYA